MGTICKVGETKEIKGELYRKHPATNRGGIGCSSCAFSRGVCPLPCTRDNVKKAIEDGGSECYGTIWKRVRVSTPIDRTKAPKAKAAKHIWEPRTMEIKDSVPKTTLRALILESVDEINQLGTENAKLKNQIVSLKKKGTK